MTRTRGNMPVASVLILIVAAALLSSGCRKKEPAEKLPSFAPAAQSQSVPPVVMLNRRGMELVNAGQYDEALKAFTAAIERYPEFEQGYSNRAAVLRIQKNYDPAMADLKKSFTINPNNPVVHYNLAALHALQKQPDRALGALNRALELGFSDFEHISRDPDLDSLRKNPKYDAIIKKYRTQSGK